MGAGGPSVSVVDGPRTCLRGWGGDHTPTTCDTVSRMPGKGGMVFYVNCLVASCGERRSAIYLLTIPSGGYGYTLTAFLASFTYIHLIISFLYYIELMEEKMDKLGMQQNLKVKIELLNLILEFCKISKKPFMCI